MERQMEYRYHTLKAYGVGEWRKARAKNLYKYILSLGFKKTSMKSGILTLEKEKEKIAIQKLGNMDTSPYRFTYTREA
jgi:hypothetical protein